MDAKTIVGNYTEHDLSDMEKASVLAVKDNAKNLAFVILDRCPESREKSLAFTKLEEATMWATAAIARERCR